MQQSTISQAKNEGGRLKIHENTYKIEKFTFSNEKN
jgi:hypothetical protein